MAFTTDFKDMKIDLQGVKWFGGITLGLLLIKVPVVGVTVGSFSAFMFFSNLRSEENKAKRYYNKGLNHFNQNHYSYAYILFKKAYELNDESPEIIRHLLESNLYIKKDPVEARMLLDILSTKWRNNIGDSVITELKEKLQLNSAS